MHHGQIKPEYEANVGAKPNNIERRIGHPPANLLLREGPLTPAPLPLPLPLMGRRVTTHKKTPRPFGQGVLNV